GRRRRGRNYRRRYASARPARPPKRIQRPKPPKERGRNTTDPLAASIRTLGTIVISAARQTLGCPDIRAAGAVDGTGAKWFNAAHAGSPSPSSASLDLARAVR